MPTTPIDFGPFRLSDEFDLTREGKPIGIGQRALAVLWELAKAGGEPVSKSRLLEACWPNMTIEEGNLTVQIAALRKVLGQTDEGLDWIVTVPRVGYRLPKKEVPKPIATRVQSKSRSIAVLPFRNLSADQNNDYFAASLAAEITGALARYKSLSVHLADSTGDGAPHALELGLSYLVKGSTMRSGDKLRVVVNLIEGSSNEVVWNHRFDATMADIFAVQDTIAATVAARVEPAISDQEFERLRRTSPVNLSAYDLYLKALHLHSRGHYAAQKEAFGLLQQALQLDPDNVLSISLTCGVLAHSIAMGGAILTADHLRLAEHYARRSIELADGNARIMARAALALQGCNEYHTALAIAETAYSLNPNDWLVAAIEAIVKLHCGDLDLAIERFTLANRQGPAGSASRFALTGLAHAMILRGRYQEAIGWADKSMAASSGFAATYWMLIAANAHLGRLDIARKWLGLLLEKWPGVTVATIRAGQPSFNPERIEPILEGLAKADLPKG